MSDKKNKPTVEEQLGRIMSRYIEGTYFSYSDFTRAERRLEKELEKLGVSEAQFIDCIDRFENLAQIYPQNEEELEEEQDMQDFMEYCSNH